MSFDTAVASIGNESSNNNTSSVGFFSLKNDGDEAIVRIMHDSVNDFDILTTHPITLGGKFRSINCIREPRDPMDKCPLCNNGTKVQSRIFIHMIQYVANAQGQVEAKPVVWERSISYATKLKNDIDEYGPLSNCIFKIRRNGKAGDMQTTYDMRLGNPSVYNEANYPKIPDAFKNYTACGTIVLDKNYEEMCTFVSTGAFPEIKKSDATSYAEPSTNSSSTYMPTTDTSRAPWESPASANGAMSDAPSRPTRYY